MNSSRLGKKVFPEKSIELLSTGILTRHYFYCVISNFLNKFNFWLNYLKTILKATEFSPVANMIGFILPNLFKILNVTSVILKGIVYRRDLRS
jgi:hypothetical protein